jgi:hypothetical protein
VTSGDVAIVRLTLAFAVVACRLVLTGCRELAVCLPPGSACLVLRNDPETLTCEDFRRGEATP